MYLDVSECACAYTEVTISWSSNCFVAAVSEAKIAFRNRRLFRYQRWSVRPCKSCRKHVSEFAGLQSGT